MNSTSIIETRRYLHRYPEPSFEEKETSEYICRFLQAEGIPYMRIATSVIAVVDTGREGSHTGFRGDIDALCVRELGDKAYISKNPGFMHACGHDAHTAILLHTAKAIKANLDAYDGKFTFIFQHAEEIPPGGAVTLVKDGVIDGVDRIYGLHCDPEVAIGKVMTKPGPLMAAVDRFKITVTGRGGHGAMPHLTIDPIVIAAQMVMALQTVISRNTDPLASALITIGIINGGSSFNVIPEQVIIEGTVRTLDPVVRARTEDRIRKIVDSTAQAYEGSSQIDWLKGYPVLMNDKDAVGMVMKAAQEVLGQDGFVHMPDPRLLGEDFASYLEKIPGAFFFLGTRGGEDTAYPLHNPHFDIDEKALDHGMAIFLELAKIHNHR